MTCLPTIMLEITPFKILIGMVVSLGILWRIGSREHLVSTEVLLAMTSPRKTGHV